MMIVKRFLARLFSHLPRAFLERGGTYVVRRDALWRPVNRLMSDSVVTLTILDGPARGMLMTVDLRFERRYWLGEWDRAVQEFLVNRLLPGMSFWDIGAHAGFFTILASRLVGELGTVHAFEPVPSAIERLQKAIALNQLTNITVHPSAVGAHNGQLAIYEMRSSSLSSRVPESPRQMVRCHTVQCESLADLVVMYGHPDIIKMDIEGQELEVLKANTRLLREGRPILIVEFLTANSFDEAHQTLGLDYAFERLDDVNWVLTPIFANNAPPADSTTG